MSHHINKEGQFQSDKYPDLSPDKIILSFHDPAAQVVLTAFGKLTKDKELGKDILTRLNSIQKNDLRRP